MQSGTYILLLSPPENYILDNMKVMGAAPCYTFETLKQAQEMADRLSKETIYKISICQVIRVVGE